MESNTERETILVTGASGYIGSHTCVELLLGWHAEKNVAEMSADRWRSRSQELNPEGF